MSSPNFLHKVRELDDSMPERFPGGLGEILGMKDCANQAQRLPRGDLGKFVEDLDSVSGDLFDSPSAKRNCRASVFLIPLVTPTPIVGQHFRGSVVPARSCLHHI
jgi:hypothetical protein